MDARRFDTLSRLVGRAPSRRALLPLLGGLLALPALGLVPATAKKKKKKATLCLDGQTIQASKKKKKKLLKSGATPGACAPPPPGCTPNCPGTTCGGDDGCSGTCACAAGSLCHSGVCHPCDVSCASGSPACADDLKTALTGGGTVYACPGRYVGNFTIITNVALIGAGGGEDPAANTILEAQGPGSVVVISAGITAALHGLRITGGSAPPESGGGGIFVASGAVTTIKGSALTGNEAENGGGLFNVGTVTFDSASSVTGNTVTSDVNGGGGGIYNQIFDGVTLNGANVSGNSPNNCVFVPGCTG